MTIKRQARSNPIGQSQASTIIKRSLSIAGHQTSVSLEEVFWSALKDVTERRKQSLASLVAEIDGERRNANLSSAIRVFVLHDLQARLDQATIEPTVQTGPAADHEDPADQ